MLRIKERMPHAFIGVDLIVGARGETPERFEASRQFIDSLPVSHLHVFDYSERPGTRALDIEYAVDNAEKHRRSAEMIELSARKHAEFAAQFTGTVRPVLLEHPVGDKPLGGFTDNYLRVEAAVDPAYDNTIQPMRLDTLLDDGETFVATLANKP